MLRSLRRLLALRPADAIERFVDAGYFDTAYYLTHHADVAASGDDPLLHFKTHGWREHRQCGPRFDPVAYLSAHPGIVGHANAYEHFIRSGMPPSGLDLAANEPRLSTSDDRRRIVATGLFDAASYRARRPDLPADADALLHYLAVGIREGLSPSDRFDAASHAALHPDAAEAEGNLFQHFIRLGLEEERQAGAHLAAEEAAIRDFVDRTNLFDAAFYLSAHCDVAASGADPAHHFVAYGWREHRQASEAFDPVTYLALHPEAAASGRNAYLHFMMDGGGRDDALIRPDPELPTMPDLTRMIALDLFDPNAYRSGRELSAGVDPLIHMLVFGIREGVDPSPAFDTEFYVIANPDVLDSGTPPLLHYLRFGLAEGRAGRPSHEIRESEKAIERSGLFDPTYYRACTPAAARSPGDPLRHYVIKGHLTYQAPSAAFDPVAYLAATPAARQAPIPALAHHLRHPSPVGALPGPAPGPRQWVIRPGETPLPDLDIEREWMRSVAFRHGFAFDACMATGLRREGHAVEAIAMLAARDPFLVARPAKRVAASIILVSDDLADTLCTLDSLSRHASRHKAEIIVVDDPRPGSGFHPLAEIPWIRHFRNIEKDGPLAAANTGAELAQGTFLVFLTSGARVGAGWLDELLATFEIAPKASLVGAKVFWEGGRQARSPKLGWLDACVPIERRTASGLEPASSYARQVGVCTFGALALPRATFDAVGRFDATQGEMAGGHAELSTRMRDDGGEVWFQPLARVIRRDDGTPGSDAGRLAAEGVDKHPTSRVLVTGPETPGRTGDPHSAMLVQAMKAFCALSWDVSFVPHRTFAYDGDRTDALRRQGVQCFHAPFAREIEDVLAATGRVDLVVGAGDVELGALVPSIRRLIPLAPFIFVMTSPDEVASSGDVAPPDEQSLRISAARHLSSSLELARCADATMVQTTSERRFVERQTGMDAIIEAPRSAKTRRNGPPFEARRDVALLGHFSRPRDRDATRAWLRQVWPFVRAELPPGTRVVLTGSRLSAMGPQTDARVVAGIEDDLAATLAHARIAVIASGTEGSIRPLMVEAMAHGVPIACALDAAEALDLEHGLQVLTGSSGPLLAETVLKLYGDAGLWRRIKEGGDDYIRQHHSPSSGLDTYRQLIETAEESWIRREGSRRSSLLQQLDLRVQQRGRGQRN